MTLYVKKVVKTNNFKQRMWKEGETDGGKYKQNSIYSMYDNKKIYRKHFTLGRIYDRIISANGPFNFGTVMPARPYILYMCSIYKPLNLPCICTAFILLLYIIYVWGGFSYVGIQGNAYG